MKKRCLVFFIFGVSFLWAVNANAFTYSTYASYTHTVGSSTSVIEADDTTTPPPASSIVSTVTTTNGSAMGWADNAIATSSFTEQGYGNVLVDGIMFNPEANDNSYPDILFASAVVSDQYMNMSSSPVNISLEYFIDEISLAIGDYAGAEAGIQGSPVVSYSFEIIGNGFLLWYSYAELSGGIISHNLIKSGTELGSTYFLTDPSNQNEFGYSFDQFNNTLDLGTLDPGETYEITAFLEVTVATGPFELGGKAGFFDPESVGFNGTIVETPVPVPAALILLSSGMLGIIGLRRRFSRE